MDESFAYEYTELHTLCNGRWSLVAKLVWMNEIVVSLEKNIMKVNKKFKELGNTNMNKKFTLFMLTLFALMYKWYLI